VSDAQNIANMIVRTGEDSPQERYWQDAAASITTGMILHVCYAAALESRVACLADLSHVFTRPGAGFRETLDELLNFEHDPGHATTGACRPAIRPSLIPWFAKRCRKCSTRRTATLAASSPRRKTALTLYSDPLVARNTSASDFTINDLVNHARPVSLYLVVPLPTRSACVRSFA